jgi:Tfp pilus assembly protein PilX
MKSHRRGIAMVMVIMMIFICSVLGYAAISLATIDSQTCTQQQIALQALNMARAGLFRARAQLRNDYSWGSTQSYQYTLIDGGYTVSVWPSPNNAGSTQKLWQVTSVGTYRSATRTVTAWMLLESFAKYAYFTNSELSSSGGTIWFTSSDAITGPAGTNGFFSFNHTPQFSDKVTSANNNDGDYTAAAYSYSQGGTVTNNPSQFYRYASNYTTDYPTAYQSSPNFSFSGGQPQVTLPTNTGTVKNAATLSLTGNATIVFNSNGTATVTQSGQSQTVSTAQATIYVSNGTATVSGTVSGHVTVGADNGINIPASVVYNDPTSDVLGLVTPAAITVTASANTVADLTIDASMMSFSNSFTVQNYSSGVARGTLHVFGGIIQWYRGPVGTLNSSTGAIVTGYAKDYKWDSKLLDQPPPNFPTTGNIQIMDFTDSGALGH